MDREQLYEKAFQFKKAKPWTLLTERQLFALRMPDGTVEYIGVCGSNDELYGLILLSGAENLQYYLVDRMLEAMPEEEEYYPFELGHLMAIQDNLTCLFVGKDRLAKMVCRLQNGCRTCGMGSCHLPQSKKRGKTGTCRREKRFLYHQCFPWFRMLSAHPHRKEGVPV